MLRQSQEGGTSQVFVLNRSLGNLTEAVKGLPTPRGGCQRGAPSMDLFDNKEGYIYVLTARLPRSAGGYKISVPRSRDRINVVSSRPVMASIAREFRPPYALRCAH